MEVGMEKADQKVIALRRKRDTLIGALRIMEEV